jgi:hypothetical protein
MGGSYQGSYSKNGYHKKKKLSQNAKSMLSLAALGVSAIGISGADYIHDLKEQAQVETNETIYSDTKPLEYVQEELLRENADRYSASYIMNDHNNNETQQQRQRLEDKYADKYLEITGEVNKVHTSLVDGYYISMMNDEPINTVTSWGRIICDFSDEEDRRLMQEIKTGDELTVVGYYEGTSILLELQDCDILKINGNELTK